MVYSSAYQHQGLLSQHMRKGLIILPFSLASPRPRLILFLLMKNERKTSTPMLKLIDYSTIYLTYR